ncbi:MAG: hypothetical protein QXX55_01765 [Candidatus Pacearchaeota archaeon]
MKKENFFLIIVFVFILISLISLFASAKTDSETINFVNSHNSDDIRSVVEKKAYGNLSKEVYEFVSNFAGKRGVLPSEILNISEVDFESLPKEVNIKNVQDTNLGIYQISYKKGNISDSVYVITYSTKKLAAQGDIIVAQDKRQFLNFGHSGTMLSSGFLKTATGVETSLDKGYVMVRDGSITAISTNLEVTENSLGDIEIIIYLNGKPIGFGNILSTDDIGVKKDYDVQSKGVVNFKAGDVISAYVRSNGNASWKDVITMVEITTTS